MTDSGSPEPVAGTKASQTTAGSFLDHVIKQTFPSTQPWLAIILLVVAVVLTYKGVWTAGYIWDDDLHVTRDPCIVGPLGFIDIWTTKYARICPLVISSFWLQYQAWGINALPYHLVNVVLHTASALLLWRTLLILGVRGAWLGALLWAVHPVQVESVAWISELKNTQSGFFFVLCLFCYAKWERTGATSRWLYGLALLCGAAAMASKSSTVVLPPVLLLVSWWFTGKMLRGRWLAVLPFAVMAAATVAWSVKSQTLEGGINPELARSLPERVITAARVVWFYLGKLAWPDPLIFIYPRWEVNAAAFAEWLPVAALVAFAGAVATLAWRGYPWARAVMFAGALFVIALLPVVGLVDHFFLRYSFVGDHFQYLASMAPLALAAAALVALADRLGPRLWDAASLVCIAAVLACCWLSYAHVPVFNNNIVLWRDTFIRNPDCWLAANNLGVAYLEAGQPDLAQRHYERLLRNHPQVPAGADTGRPDQAAQHYDQMAKSFASSGSIRNNMGLTLMTQGHFKEATAWFEQALLADPHDGMAHLNLANALLTTHRYPEAVEHFQKSMETVPATAATLQRLATAMLGEHKLDEAIETYHKAMKLDASSAQLHYNLGCTLAQAGRLHEAVDSFETSVKLAPGFLAAMHNLAWVLATTADDTVRNGARALEVAQRMQSLPEGDGPMMKRALAAAQFEAGQHDEAIKTVQNALLVALTARDSGLAAVLQSDLDGYKQGKPVRNAAGQFSPSPTAPSH